MARCSVTECKSDLQELYVLLISTIIYRLNRSIPYVKFKESKQKKLMRKEVINLIIAFNKFTIVLLALLIILKILGVNLAENLLN